MLLVAFYFDAESVGRSVFGEWRQLTYPAFDGRPSLLCFAVAVRQYLARLCPIKYDHVKGHSGALGNEVTDAVAKTARRLPGDFWCRCLPDWPARLAAHPLALWIWMLPGATADLPTLFAFESEAVRLRAQPPVAHVAPSMGTRLVQPPGKSVHYDITAISFNVLTLRDKTTVRGTTHVPVGLRFMGRRALLQQELAPHRPLFVGFQETRLPESAMSPDQQYYILQASATAEGSGGCALWIARNVPYASVAGSPQYLQEQQFVVTGHSDRHLNVSIVAPHLSLFVVVAHCPSLANHPASVIEAFWRERHADIVRRPAGADFIILVDADAQVGGYETEHVSSHHADTENEAGTLFHDFLVGISAFLPSTFIGIHEGPSHTLVARSFQLYCHTRHLPWSLLFVDVQAAFYRVVRQALTPHHDDDTELLRIFHRMGLPPEAVVALRQQLQCLAILPSLGTPAQVVAMVQDMMRATWFRIDNHAIITMTACGTRPGDPAADMLFALAFGEFLKSLDSTLALEGLRPEMPAAAHPPVWAQLSTSDTLGAPAWADDFFLPQTAASFCDLVARTRRTVEHTTARATSLGMKLTFAPTKTAGLLPSGHDWTLLSPDVVPEDGHLSIAFADPITREAHTLPIVHSYRHLGGILTSTTTPKPDLLLRQSQALGYVKPLRKQLFANKDIPLKVRTTVLQALSGSRLVHSAAALILPANIHQRMWDRAYLQVWRALVPRHSADKQLHSVEVLRLAQVPSPPLALAKARAAFLKQLTLHGPAILRHTLYRYWVGHPRTSWLQQLAADVRLVTSYVPSAAHIFP
ncbi:unnamed protein product [Symbiodinium sp. CCMP2592]|nr:unnamed protein product [Symbiodinium sp. CCMP2592]